MSNFVNLLDIIYPIGSVYITFSATSPANAVGGTWELLENVFLYSSTGTTGTIGGERTHTLTTDEIPSHKHALELPMIVPWREILLNVWNTPQWTNHGTTDYYGQTDPNRVTTDCVGGGQAHNNMPPYITVYMYRRTA